MSAGTSGELLMLRVTNPATAELIAELEEDDARRLARKTASARAAQSDWAATPLDRRLAAVRRFGQLIQFHHERLAQTLTAEVGKPIRQSRNELKAMQGRIDFFLRHTEAAIQDEVVDLGSGPPPLEERIRYEPLGIVGNISAWNYPYFVGSNVYLPALLTGNAVLYKPSEYATLSGLAVTDLLHESGIPAEVFQPVVGAGDIGRMLLEQDIDAVCFTGSYATGKKIATEAAPRLLRVQLELGGKDPAYICDDVDVAAAAGALVEGAFYNTGQSCCAVERIYVHRGIAAPFVRAFLEAARALVMGDPADERTDIGPLARRPQLEVLESQVRDAVAKGATVLLGGKRCDGRGNYFEPTVLVGVDHRMAVMWEESFGPIIGIQEVRDDEEAVRLMNDTDYGLTAAVYSLDRARAERILSQVNAGSAYWNCCDRVSPRLPWTGRKHSGLGTTLSVAGIRSFVQPKAWHLRGG
jgi:acyl-CoA reductase-like NAD-dependent aldehyde dehydrogenase